MFLQREKKLNKIVVIPLFTIIIKVVIVIVIGIVAGLAVVVVNVVMDVVLNDSLSAGLASLKPISMTLFKDYRLSLSRRHDHY